MYLALMTCFRA